VVFIVLIIHNFLYLLYNKSDIIIGIYNQIKIILFFNNPHKGWKSFSWIIAVISSAYLLTLYGFLHFFYRYFRRKPYIGYFLRDTNMLHAYRFFLITLLAPNNGLAYLFTWYFFTYRIEIVVNNWHNNNIYVTLTEIYRFFRRSPFKNSILLRGMNVGMGGAGGPNGPKNSLTGLTIIAGTYLVGKAIKHYADIEKHRYTQDTLKDNHRYTQDTLKDNHRYTVNSDIEKHKLSIEAQRLAHQKRLDAFEKQPWYKLGSPPK
jgi:hypothetical protein